MNFLSWIVYVPVQILFLPVVTIGTVLVAYKQIVVSKRLGISMTAIEVINGRWTMHFFGMREDEATARLAAALPNTSLLGLKLSLFPLWLKYKISGQQALYPRMPEPGAEAVLDLVVGRTLYFDSIIEGATEQVEQFVTLGAGYDTRAYGALRDKGISFFELDQPNVQKHKRAMLSAAGIAFDHATFVEIDFTKDRAMERLVESGFDVSKKTLFLWEGVTLYLSETEVRAAMHDIRSTACAGSLLLADIYASRFNAIAKKGASKKTLDSAGEGLDFDLDFANNHEEVLAEFVESEGFAVGETYFMGRKNEKGPFVVVVEMLLN